MSAQIDVLESYIRSLSKQAISEEEREVLLEIVGSFKFSVERSLTYFLENLSKWRAVVGFVLARIDMVCKESESRLEIVFSRRYNEIRQGGVTSRGGKPLPAEAIKNRVKSDSEFVEQQAVVNRAEYHRSILRELKESLIAKSREVEHLSNNMRLQVRLESE